jgi:hypothetical protein
VLGVSARFWREFLPPVPSRRSPLRAVPRDAAARKGDPPEEESGEFTPEEIAAMIREAVENPFAHFEMKRIRHIFNFGRSAMAKIAKLNPPMVTGKLNPGHFKTWLWENREALGDLKA